ncbi:unnamed protein product, partial [Ixodes hexagonus]
DPDLYLGVEVNLPAVQRRASLLTARRAVKKNYQAAWLLRAVTCIDLTTLSGDDTSSNVHRLCTKAASPAAAETTVAVEYIVTTGAVCVYPARVADCVKTFGAMNLKKHIPIAAVATGFPTGQYALSSRLAEIEYAVESGASEIDVVINRTAALTGNWEIFINWLTAGEAAVKQEPAVSACADASLGSWRSVAIVDTKLPSLNSGADFIKTSTGKEGVNAILPVGIVMARAIWDYYQDTGFRVGFKPAGGIRTAKDALSWQFLMKEELGDEWLQPDLFRIGASGLLGDIERQLFHHVTGRYAALSEMPPC